MRKKRERERKKKVTRSGARGAPSSSLPSSALVSLKRPLDDPRHPRFDSTSFCVCFTVLMYKFSLSLFHLRRRQSPPSSSPHQPLPTLPPPPPPPPPPGSASGGGGGGGPSPLRRPSASCSASSPRRRRRPGRTSCRLPRCLEMFFFFFLRAVVKGRKKVSVLFC